MRQPSRTIVTDTPALNLASEAVSASDGAVSSSSVDPYDLHPQSTDRWRFSNVAGLTLRSSRQHLDDRARLASIENTVTGTRTTFTYHSVTGLLWRVQDPSGRITQYERDALGRVEEVIRDQSGSPVRTRYAYAGTSVAAAQVTQPNGQVLQYDYDDWGALVRSSATDMGTTVTTFDPAGRRTHQLESNGTHTVWLYDAADRVVNIDYDADHSWINGGDRGFWYDALPSGVSCPSGSTCGNLLGRLAYVENHATDPYTHRTYYGYTTAGLLQHENIAIGGLATNTAYTYDSVGRRTHMTFPFGTGDGVGYGYGGANGSADEHQVTSIDWDINGGSVRPIVERIDRMPNGPISHMWFRQRAAGGLPANASVERNWAVNGTPSTVRWRSGLNTSANLADWTYTYQSNGLIAGLSNAANSADTVNYRYDALDRLDCATTGSTSTTCAAGNAAAIATYTTDASGNRTAAWDRYSNFSRTWSYPANSNRAQNWRRTIWSPGDHVAWNWGGAGGTSPGQRVSETVSGFTRSYAYWPTGEVASVAVSDARGYASYTSANDHRGRRMFTRTTAPSGTVTESWFVYDDEDKLIGVRHYSGGTVRDEMLFYADGEPVFRMALDNGWSEVDRSFLYADHLGTPRIGVSVDGSMGAPTVTYRAPREPFMASAPVQQNAVPVRLRFPGQWEDVDTQFTLWNGDQLSTPLLGNHARTMDPSAGAYTAVEPMWRAGGRHGYMPAFSYVESNPTMGIDPTGMVWTPAEAWLAVRNAARYLGAGVACVEACVAIAVDLYLACLVGNAINESRCGSAMRVPPAQNCRNYVKPDFDSCIEKCTLTAAVVGALTGTGLWSAVEREASRRFGAQIVQEVGRRALQLAF
jgi:RHS repeat-associated protein